MTVSLIIAIAIALTCAVIYGTFTCPLLLELDEQELYFRDLPLSLDGLKIFFCGDLHIRRWDYRVLWVQDQILKSGADLILFSGDIVEKSGISALDDFLLPLGRGLYRGKSLNDAAGIDVSSLEKLAVDSSIGGDGDSVKMFFCPGNNENELEDKLLVFKKFEDAGFKVLVNGNYRAGELVVAGTDDPSRDKDDINKALSGTEDCFKIVISHSPEIFPDCVAHKVPLTLTGHTHGGQVRLPGIGALWVDTPRVKGRYDCGLFEENDCKMIVTKGVGMSKLPIRTFCNPQVHLLTLKKK